MTYYANDIIRISGSFTDEAGAATDPTNLVLVIKGYGEDGVEYTAPEVENDAVGEYHMMWTVPAVSGHQTYVVQWQPTGAVQRASKPSVIHVRPLVSAAVS